MISDVFIQTRSLFSTGLKIGATLIAMLSFLGCQGMIREIDHLGRRGEAKKVSSRKQSLKKETQVKRFSPPSSHYEKIMSEVKKWNHTKYRWGGTGNSGLDCSGFVMIVFKNLYDIELPRTTKSQIQYGSPVSKNSLNAGDLVFFQVYQTRRHVGIFLKNGEFAHVSSKKGVRISNMNDSYWRSRFLAARRVL